MCSEPNSFEWEHYILCTCIVIKFVNCEIWRLKRALLSLNKVQENSIKISDEHPRLFHMGVPPRALGSLHIFNRVFKFW